MGVDKNLRDGTVGMNSTSSGSSGLPRSLSGSGLSVREVAARAGVSVGTVSNVLNRPHIVAAQTRERVQRAINDLGFVVNGSARNLRAGRTLLIGVMVLDIVNPFWGEITRGIESAAGEAGYSIILGSSDESSAKADRYLRIFEEHRVDGLLAAPVRSDVSAYEKLNRRGISVVLLDRISTSGEISAVAVDDVRGGELAASHLLELGHERLGFVHGPLKAPFPWSADRRQGVHRAVSSSGLDPKRSVVEITASGLNARAGEAVVDRLLDAKPRPTAVFCANDLLALGVLRGLTSRGISVPEDLSLVGYDDVDFAALLSPPLTTVRQPPYRLGRTAAELLLHATETAGDHKPRQITFQPELIVRESSKSKRV